MKLITGFELFSDKDKALYYPIITASMLNASKFYSEILFYTNSKDLREELKFLPVTFKTIRKKSKYRAHMKVFALQDRLKHNDIDFIWFDVDMIISQKLVTDSKRDFICEKKYPINKGYFLYDYTRKINEEVGYELISESIHMNFAPGLLKFNKVEVLRDYLNFHTKFLNMNLIDESTILEELPLTHTIHTKKYSWAQFRKLNEKGFIHFHNEYKFSTFCTDMFWSYLLLHYPEQYSKIVGYQPKSSYIK